MIANDSNKGATAWRWLIVLPTAIASYVVSGVLFYIGSGGSPDATMMLFSYLVSPAVYIYCGTLVAPSHKFGTAIILTVLWAIVVTALFTWSATARGYDNWFQTGKSLTWAICGVISTLTTCYFIHKSEEDLRRVEEIINERKAAEEEAKRTAETPEAYDPYAILGIDLGASFEEIRRAYRERMKEYHPDKVAGLGIELRTLAEQKAKEINMAFQDLRQKYDAA